MARPGEVDVGPRAERTRLPGRAFPGDVAADAPVEELPERRALGVEELQCVVRVIGEQPSGHGVARDEGAGLVDPGLGIVVGRVEEPELQAGRRREARGQLGRRRRGGRGEVRRPVTHQRVGARQRSGASASRSR